MRRGDDGFEEFVRESSASLLRTAYLLAGGRQEAEDLVQSALEIGFRHWNRIAGMESRSAYVRRILVNLASKRRRDGLEVPGPVPEPVTGDETQTVAERDVLVRALATLPPRMRAVLVLRFYEGLSERQTADVLGVGLGTVKTQAHRGLERMRGVLQATASTAARERNRSWR